MLQRISDAIRSFMAGRNGVDGLAWFWCILGIVLNLLGSFTGLGILTLLAYIPLVLALYRIFSRNTAQRHAENENSGSSLPVSGAEKATATSSVPAAGPACGSRGGRARSKSPVPPAGRAL